MKTSRITKLVSILVVISMFFTLEACGKANTDKAQSSAAPAASANATIDPLAKYNPPVEITAWRYTEPSIKFENGDTIDNNIYMKAYLEELGIKVKYKWVVPQDQFEQKLNISIASGDLADIMWLRNTQLTSLAENNSLYDLTKLFQNNTSKLTRDIMLQDETSFNTGKIGGKLVGLPHTLSAIDGMQLMFIRTDWLQKLNLSEPKTMQDVLNIADAFTKKDPDGDGKNDTYGMGLCKNILTENHLNINGFAVAYHAYPRRWVKDSSGKLAYGSVQPEMKTALKQLQDMFANGSIDKEFGVKDRAKAAELIANGSVGLEFGGMSGPGSILKDSVVNDKNAEWKAYAIPSIDSKPAAPIIKMPVSLYYGVNKDCKNPDALMKVIEFGTKGYAPDAEVDSPYGTSKTGVPVYMYSLANYEPAKKNLDAHLHILDAIKANSDTKLSAEEKGYYKGIVEYRKTQDKAANKGSNWSNDRIFGSPSSFDVINQVVESKNYIYDGFYGSPTPAMVDQKSTLEKMEDEVFTKIIMGQSVDTFDKFVADWKKLGGDQMTKEVNDWAAKNK